MAHVTMSFTRSGLRDWLWQRFSALVLGAYVVFLALYIFSGHPVTFAGWHALFAIPAMKVFSVLAMGAFLVHAWIGLWTVFTDYVSCRCMRLFLYALLAVILWSEFFWGLLTIVGVLA